MNTEFHPRMSGHRAYSLIGNIGQENQKRDIKSTLARRQTSKAISLILFNTCCLIICQVCPSGGLDKITCEC